MPPKRAVKATAGPNKVLEAIKQHEEKDDLPDDETVLDSVFDAQPSDSDDSIDEDVMFVPLKSLKGRPKVRGSGVDVNHCDNVPASRNGQANTPPTQPATASAMNPYDNPVILKEKDLQVLNANVQRLIIEFAGIRAKRKAYKDKREQLKNQQKVDTVKRVIQRKEAEKKEAQDTAHKAKETVKSLLRFD